MYIYTRRVLLRNTPSFVFYGQTCPALCARPPPQTKVIKKPMDLSLIRQRIMSGALLSLDDMSRDLFVMCNNAMVFNGKGDPYFDYSKVYIYIYIRRHLCLHVFTRGGIFRVPTTCVCDNTRKPRGCLAHSVTPRGGYVSIPESETHVSTTPTNI